jgi:hypothetical protein
VYVPKWVLALPVIAVALMAGKEFPALIRYVKIARM